MIGVNPLPLRARVLARIDGDQRPGEIRGRSFKDGDLYDVMTDGDRRIYPNLTADKVKAIDAPLAIDGVPVLRIGSAKR